MSNKMFLGENQFLYQVIQKCGCMKNLGIFFKQPTKIHFISNFSGEINLAQTSFRNHIKFVGEKLNE